VLFHGPSQRRAKARLTLRLGHARAIDLGKPRASLRSLRLDFGGLRATGGHADLALIIIALQSECARSSAGLPLCRSLRRVSKLVQGWTRERLHRHYDKWKGVVDDRKHPDHHKVRTALHDDPSFRPAFPKQETVRHDGPKLGANDPCRCGSGKKFKRCCRQ